MKELPKNIEAHLDTNILFNKFGIVNLNAIKGQFKTDLTKEELKDAINKRFGNEFTGGIEYIDK